MTFQSLSQGLPKHFSEKHLPKREAGIVLEDENGEDHHTTYLDYKQGLSAGWRGFAIYHGLKVGDVVVFELVKSTKFKASFFGEQTGMRLSYFI